MDPLFSDDEKRFVLAEIIKASHVDLPAIADFVNTQGIQPEWMQMELPRGRNMRQCIQVAQYLGVPPAAEKRKSSHDHTEQPAKRPAPTDKRETPNTNVGTPSSGPVTIAPRTLLPRPTPPSESSPAPSLQLSSRSPTSPPPQRKRGRPSRLERSKRLRPPVLPQIAPRPEQTLLRPSQPIAPLAPSGNSIDSIISYSTSSGQAELQRNKGPSRHHDDAGPLTGASPHHFDPQLSRMSAPRVMPDEAPANVETEAAPTTSGIITLEPEPRAILSSLPTDEDCSVTLPPLVKKEDEPTQIDPTCGEAQLSLANSA